MAPPSPLHREEFKPQLVRGRLTVRNVTRFKAFEHEFKHKEVRFASRPNPQVPRGQFKEHNPHDDHGLVHLPYEPTSSLPTLSTRKPVREESDLARFPHATLHNAFSCTTGEVMRMRDKITTTPKLSTLYLLALGWLCYLEETRPPELRCFLMPTQPHFEVIYV